APDLAGDHDPAGREERRRLGRVDDRRDRGVGVITAAHLLHHETNVLLPDQLVHEGAGRVAHEDGIVAPHQIDGKGLTHAASRIAARTSHTRRVPFTSWARTMRQPRATPTAAAASDASP